MEGFATENLQEAEQAGYRPEQPPAGNGTNAAIHSPRHGDGPIFTINQLTGCHIWERSLDEDGYGYFKADGRMVRAHIHYYEQANGPVPDGMVLDHLCRHRQCCNPEHLEPVTRIENSRRGRVVKHMTIEAARKVRTLRAAGKTYKQICGEMGISKSLAAQILTNRCWKDESAVASARSGK